MESEVNTAFLTAVQRFPFNNVIVISIVQTIFFGIEVKVAFPRCFLFRNCTELQKVRILNIFILKSKEISFTLVNFHSSSSGLKIGQSGFPKKNLMSSTTPSSLAGIKLLSKCVLMNLVEHDSWSSQQKRMHATW